MVHKTNWLKLVVHTSTLIITNWTRMNILPSECFHSCGHASCMKAGRLVSPPFWFRLKSVNFYLDRLPEQYSCFQRINTQVDVHYFLFTVIEMWKLSLIYRPWNRSDSHVPLRMNRMKWGDPLTCVWLSHSTNRTGPESRQKKRVRWFQWSRRSSAGSAGRTDGQVSR